MGSSAHNHAKATLSKPINLVRRASVVTDTTKSDVLDRKLEEEKKPCDAEPPRIRCLLCGWSLRKAGGHPIRIGMRSIDIRAYLIRPVSVVEDGFTLSRCSLTIAT